MGFEGKTNLHDTKAEHNHTNSPHQTENEIGQIVDYLNGVIGSKGGWAGYRACSSNGDTAHASRQFSWRSLMNL